MDFQDFPMFWGNLGVEGDHPPKMCAGLIGIAAASDEPVKTSAIFIWLGGYLLPSSRLCKSYLEAPRTRLAHNLGRRMRYTHQIFQ